MYSLRNSGAQYVSNNMPRQLQNCSLCLGNTSAKKIAEASAETILYYAGNGFSICQHFAKGYDSFYWQLRLLVVPKLYCVLIAHLNGRNGRQNFSRSSPCFGFFVHPCKLRRTHYPTLEKPLEILNLHEKPNI